MKASETLKEALKLVKKGWRKGGYALDKDGNEVDYLKASAVKFCATGAILKTSIMGDSRTPYTLMLKVINTDSIADWNDMKSRTKKQVIAAFKKAIKLAEKTEKK